MSDFYPDILERIKYLVEVEKRENFILYPFGERGRLAKSILNVYFGVQEFMIVDNKLAEEYSTICKVDDLKEVSLEDKTILFTSNNYTITDELIGQLKQVVPECVYVELFPYNEEKLTHDEQNYLREIERKHVILQKVKEECLADNGMCYSPKKTKSKFFMPYVNLDSLQQIIFMSDNYYEANILQKVFFEYREGLLKDRIKNGGTVLDIGANIGNHTLYFANELGAEKVVSFEPVEEIFWILSKNIELNNLQKKVELYPVGVSDIKGNAMLTNFNYACMGGIPLSVKKEGCIELVALDDLQFENVVFMKIDVEGMEMKVLRGGCETIKRNHPYILVESFSNKVVEVKEFLYELGYSDYIELEDSNYLFV